MDICSIYLIISFEVDRRLKKIFEIPALCFDTLRNALSNPFLIPSCMLFVSFAYIIRFQMAPNSNGLEIDNHGSH